MNYIYMMVKNKLIVIIYMFNFIELIYLLEEVNGKMQKKFWNKLFNKIMKT